MMTAQNAQKQMAPQPMPSSAFDTSRVQMEDHTNSAQASMSTHTPFFNGRPMQTAIARPAGPEDPGKYSIHMTCFSLLNPQFSRSYANFL